MTPAAFQERVDAVIAVLEQIHDAQYPLRRVPMDLVAEAVARDAGAIALEDLSAGQIAACLNGILARQNPASAVRFQTAPSAFDVVSPWQGSSYQVHDGAERLKDGG